MDKKDAIKKLSLILATLEQIYGNIPDEYLIDGVVKELGMFDEKTMHEIIAEAKKINKGKSK